MRFNKQKILLRIFLIFAIGVGYGGIATSITSHAINNTDKYDINNLSYEEKYKFQCRFRMNSEIMSIDNPEFYFDEQLSVVGRVVAVEDNSTYDNTSGHIYTDSNVVFTGKKTNITYHISDEGLSDGGGIWRFNSTDDSFKVGDMIIIYGTGATAVYNPDYVWMTVKYVNFYTE